MFLQEECNHCSTAARIDNSCFDQMSEKGIAVRNADG